MPRTSVVAAVVLASACGGASSSPTDDDYLTSSTARRATLVASLVNPNNGYSRLRLEHYDTGKLADWSLLPEWNPRVDVIAASELDAGVNANAPVKGAALDLTSSTLGEDAFFRYPVQLVPGVAIAAASRESFARFGFWTDDTRGAGGLVHVELPGGKQSLGYTCATCHAAPRNGQLVIGVGSETINLGSLAASMAPFAPTSQLATWLSWGPGLNDVTTPNGVEPVRIADLRPVRWLTHLHADASVAQNDLASLAVRVETLIITSQGNSVRPPREVALALARYIWSLADTLPPAPPSDDAGAALFQGHCAACHTLPALTGAPVPLAAVGTDPVVGRSADRGTGFYRVPSLHGAGNRGAYFHDASVGSLAEVLNPARVNPDYAGGRRRGPVPGHTYGLDLDDTSRAALIAYVAKM